MGKKKVLIKTGHEGKYVVDVDEKISMDDLKVNTRVALKNDSYKLHRILPTKVDPLVSLMKVEKVPDSVRCFVIAFVPCCPLVPCRASSC